MNKKHRNYNNTPEIPLGGLLDKPAPLFTLEWWQYGAALGYIVPVVAVLAFDYTGTLLLIIGLHLMLDFNIQTNDTATRKACGEVWATLYHSLITGFFAALPLGFKAALLSAAIHLLIDACRKFGVTGWRGGILDQSLHILTLAGLWILHG